MGSRCGHEETAGRPLRRRAERWGCREVGRQGGARRLLGRGSWSRESNGLRVVSSSPARLCSS